MAGESQQVPSSTPDPTVLTTEQLLRETENIKATIDAEIAGLRDLTAERFLHVNARFEAIERQRVEQKKDNNEKVDAAFAAAKEAIGAVAAIVSDVKDRVGRIENVRVGGQQAYSGLYVAAGLFVAFAGVAIALVVGLR